MALGIPVSTISKTDNLGFSTVLFLSTELLCDEKHIEETCREGNNDLTSIGLSIYNYIQVF